MAAVMEQLLHSSLLSSDLAEIVSDIQKSVVLVRGRRGTGSGVVWDTTGTIITNAHVVHEPNAEVVFENGDRFAARVTQKSDSLDLAVLTPENGASYKWPAVSVRDSAELRAGELVLAVGNPMGERNVATMGMLVAPPAPPAGNLRAAITLRPGNSGGAMVDAQGRVVGIPHIVMGGGLAQAVSSRAVKRFLQADANRGKPVLGIMGHWVEIPPRYRQAHNLAVSAGLLVADVTVDGTADRSGIILGDLILGYGNAASDPRSIVELSDWEGEPGTHRLATLRAGELHWLDVDSSS